jgi:hypothetical protein
VIQEDEYGFIFSKYLDSLTVDYDFRVVKLLGDKELIFKQAWPALSISSR